MDTLDRERLSELVAERDEACTAGSLERRAYVQGRIDEYVSQNAIDATPSNALDLQWEDGRYDA